MALGAAAILVFAACSGGSMQSLPQLHASADRHGANYAPAYACTSCGGGGGSGSGTPPGGVPGGGSGGGDPGCGPARLIVLPHGGVRPAGGTGGSCGGGGAVAAGTYRSPEQRACNSRGGVFVTTPSGNTMCSADSGLRSVSYTDVGCLVTIATVPISPSSNQVGINISGAAILTQSYNSVYGAQLNSDCSITIFYQNPNSV